MNKWLALPAMLVIVLIIWTATTHITRETILSETQAISRVETFYNGKVQNTIKKDAQYFVTFETGYGIYEVAVDEENGRFSQLHVIQKFTPTDKLPSESPSKSDEQVQPHITAEQARIIALDTYAGEVEDISYFTTTDGGYYLVEVDTENADLILQIHAVTGKILSVSFED